MNRVQRVKRRIHAPFVFKTLQSISKNDDVDHDLMFAGHGAYRFGQDPYYANGFVPTVQQLVEQLQTGY